jgi:regulator of nucleoside diphosphate kinase
MTMHRPDIILTRHDLGRLDSLLGDTVVERLGKVGTYLLDELTRARVVADSEVPPDVVTMNSTVRFRDDDTGREMVGKLMYPKDATGSENAVSVLTPVGAALLGLSAGQKIAYETLDGRIKTLTVLAVQARTGSDPMPGARKRQPAARAPVSSHA